MSNPGLGETPDLQRRDPPWWKCITATGSNNRLPEGTDPQSWASRRSLRCHHGSPHLTSASRPYSPSRSSCPRSAPGSTLLGRDLESLGGFGRPREHFAGVNTREEGRGHVRNGRARGSPAWYRKVLSRASPVSTAGQSGRGGRAGAHRPSTRDISRGDVHGGLLGAGQVRPSARGRPGPQCHRHRDLPCVRHGDGTYNSTRPGALQAGAALPSIPDINHRILSRFERALMDISVLNTVAAEYSDVALLLTYNELTGQVEETTRRLVAHARELGLEPREFDPEYGESHQHRAVGPSPGVVPRLSPDMDRSRAWLRDGHRFLADVRSSRMRLHERPHRPQPFGRQPLVIASPRGST